MDSEWDALRGRLLGRPKTLFKIPDIVAIRTYRYGMIEVFELVNQGRHHNVHGLVNVSHCSGSKVWVLDIRSVFGIACILVYGRRNWHVNTSIDLRTWDDIY